MNKPGSSVFIQGKVIDDTVDRKVGKGTKKTKRGMTSQWLPFIFDPLSCLYGKINKVWKRPLS